MTLTTPRWWYLREGTPGPITRALLRPLSWAWAWSTARRIRLGRPVDPGAPVICIGNLTLGGAGKTPVAREIVRRLTLQGVQAHVLARGHGGRLAGPTRVDASVHASADVGDEPLMLSRDGPVWISRDRAQGAAQAVAAGAEVIVMDDGHQNPGLRKTLSLVVVDGETRDGEWPFGDGAVFPSGPMREPLKAGLGRADAVVVLLPADLERADPELLAVLNGKLVFTARMVPFGPPPPGPQLGFAGVAKPWKVERALKAAGCDLRDFASLPDHAALDTGLLKALADRAAVHGAGLVTTEKDWVRLPHEWRDRIAAWPVAVRFDDEPGLDALLAQALSSARQPMSER